MVRLLKMVPTQASPCNPEHLTRQDSLEPPTMPSLLRKKKTTYLSPSTNHIENPHTIAATSLAGALSSAAGRS